MKFHFILYMPITYNNGLVNGCGAIKCYRKFYDCNNGKQNLNDEHANNHAKNISQV